jgi:hypothetical protein
MIVEHKKSETDGQKYPFLGHSKRGYLGHHYFIKAGHGEYWHAIDNFGVRVDNIDHISEADLDIRVFKVGDVLTLTQE